MVARCLHVSKRQAKRQTYGIFNAERRLEAVTCIGNRLNHGFDGLTIYPIAVLPSLQGALPLLGLEEG